MYPSAPAAGDFSGFCHAEPAHQGRSRWPRPATAAALIASSGGSSLVQSRKAWAAWWMSIPRPLTVRSPWARAAASRGVTAGWYTRSTTDLAGAEAGRRRTGSGSGLAVGGDHHPHAERGGVDHEVGGLEVVGGADPGDGTGQRARPRSAGSGERLSTAIDAAPPLASARATARPAPPAPTTDAARAGHLDALVEPERVEEARARRCCRRAAAPPCRVMQFTAPSASRVVGQLVEALDHRGLVGHRDRQALEPERPHPAHGQAGGALRHLEGEVGPVEPRGREGGVEDGRRQRVPDRRADHAGGSGVAGEHGYPQPSPASRHRSLAARNSLLLSVKKWLPSASSST